MPKVIGITIGLLILKTGEIILIYRAMPLIRGLWKRVLATDCYQNALDYFWSSVRSDARSSGQELIRQQHALIKSSKL